MTLSSTSLIAIIGALAADELAKIRKSDPQLWKARQWSSDTVITTAARAKGGDREIQVDSFEWMSIVSRVVNFFQIESSGLEDYLLRVSSLGEWADVVATSREKGSQDIRFSSSGSTGQPHKYEQRWCDLLNEASFFAEYLKQHSMAVTRVISAVPPQHIYGFIFSIVLPEVLQVPVIRGLKAFTLAQSQRLRNGDLLVGFPTWYQQLVQTNTAFPQGAFAVCSSGPVAANVLQRLHQQGVKTIVEVYGSTETSGIGVRQQRDDWYQLLPRWQRHDEHHLTDGYRNQTVALPDHIEWLDADHFKPLARRDEALQVNGYNVYPQRIAAIIAEHPNVRTARVRLLHADDSRGLKALIVTAESARDMPPEAVVAQVASWLAPKLEDAEMPRKFSVANKIPLNDMGKEIDWDLQADLMSR